MKIEDIQIKANLIIKIYYANVFIKNTDKYCNSI